MFKTVAETGKRGEVLKGDPVTSPGGGGAGGGKGLAMSQYKVAPHRNIKVGLSSGVYFSNNTSKLRKYLSHFYNSN